MSATELGLYLGLVGVGYIFGNFLTGRFSEKWGIEMMMTLGGVVASVGVVVSLFLMVSFEPRAEFLFMPMIFLGVGNGMNLSQGTFGVWSARGYLRSKDRSFLSSNF